MCLQTLRMVRNDWMILAKFDQLWRIAEKIRNRVILQEPKQEQ